MRDIELRLAALEREVSVIRAAQVDPRHLDPRAGGVRPRPAFLDAELIRRRAAEIRDELLEEADQSFADALSRAAAMLAARDLGAPAVAAAACANHEEEED